MFFFPFVLAFSLSVSQTPIPSTSSASISFSSHFISLIIVTFCRCLQKINGTLNWKKKSFSKFRMGIAKQCYKKLNWYNLFPVHFTTLFGQPFDFSFFPFFVGVWSEKSLLLVGKVTIIFFLGGDWWIKKLKLSNENQNEENELIQLRTWFWMLWIWGQVDFRNGGL